MDIRIVSEDSRKQIKLLRELADLLEKASKVQDALNEGVSNHSPSTNGTVITTVNPGHNFLAGSRKAHLELAYTVLREASAPLGKRELLKRMQAKGSTLTKADTLPVYLKADPRFKRGPVLGEWELAT